MLLFVINKSNRGCGNYRNTQKAQTSCCLFAKRGLSIPLRSNKQQETYAGMKTHYAIYKHSMDIFIPIGIY